VPETFTVSPALPGGISLDPANGIISGTCDGDLGITQHTVTATNPLGSSAAQVQIEILPAPGLRGYLVPSGGDGTLDVFDDRNLGFGPIDAAYCNGAAPVATVGTADGRFVFAACSDSNLYRADRDTTSGRLGPLTQVAGAFGVRHLLATSDGQHLVVVADTSVTRYDLAGDGSICCASQIPGPFAPSAALLATNQVLVLATSAPGTLTVYDLVPILQQRAGSVLVGADVAIAALLDRDGGRHLYAATSTYDFNTHALTGALRNFTLSTPAEISGGAAAAVQTQSITRGGELTSLHYRELSSGNVREVFVADGSQGRVYVFSSAADGTLSTANVATHVIGGRPVALGLGTRTSDIAVLDETQEQLSTYRSGSGDFELMSRTRTRRLPRALVPLFGDDSTAVADQFFVTSAADSTLLAVRIDPVVPGELLASAQGPVTSGSTPLDVATSHEAPLVFTADLGGAGISAFRCDPATQLLTPTDTEALSPGSQPIALAVTTSGDHLHAVDRTGRIVAFSVDSSTGTVGHRGLARTQRFPGGRRGALGRAWTIRVHRPTGGGAGDHRIDPPAGRIPALVEHAELPAETRGHLAAARRPIRLRVGPAAGPRGGLLDRSRGWGLGCTRLVVRPVRVTDAPHLFSPRGAVLPVSHERCVRLGSPERARLRHQPQLAERPALGEPDSDGDALQQPRGGDQLQSAQPLGARPALHLGRRRGGPALRPHPDSSVLRLGSCRKRDVGPRPPRHRQPHLMALKTPQGATPPWASWARARARSTREWAAVTPN
jgi:hypothetical protein